MRKSEKILLKQPSRFCAAFLKEFQDKSFEEFLEQPLFEFVDIRAGNRDKSHEEFMNSISKEFSENSKKKIIIYYYIK